MDLSGFIHQGHFDLNSYLNYLFSKMNEHSAKEENTKQKNLKIVEGRIQSDRKK